MRKASEASVGEEGGWACRAGRAKRGPDLKRALLILLALCSIAQARRDRTVSGDIIKAARFLQSARLDDAKAILADLEKRAPDTIEVRWLEAELAFQTGDYAAVPKLLDKIPDDAVDGMVKHGGDYNLDGGQPFPDAGSDGGTAIGWAFMGLTPPDDAGAGVSILWQAPFPPPNAGYGPTNGDCNGCHHDAQANDYVKITDDDAGFWASGELMLSHY